jgi:ADP-ribosylation factor GTPase-activating protein 2/3
MAQPTKTILEGMTLGPADAKGFIDDSVRDEFFKKFRTAPEHGNRTCLDCPNRNPTWISLSHGSFVCLECSGEHRRKGVHISFVRSADMDKFTVEQLSMMAVGGNTKAREYFKKQGMGPTSESGKPINYNSNAALRYRQQIEKEAHDVCKRLGAQCKTSAATAEKVSQEKASAAEDTAANFFDDALKGTAPSVSKCAAPSPPVANASKAMMPSPPAPQGPSTTVVRKAAPPPQVKQPTFTGAVAKGKPAKVMDFDFDFDEIESCAAAPKPVPAPMAAKPPPPCDVPKQPACTHQPVGYAASEVPKAKAPEPAINQFAGRKALSSDDFFNDQDSASARQERESQYNKFSSSGAISSDAFFGRSNEQEEKSGFGGFFSNLASSATDYMDNMKSQGNSGNPMVDAIGGYMNRRSPGY